MLSNSAKKGSTTGEIVNLMSVDAQKLSELVYFLNIFYQCKFTLINGKEFKARFLFSVLNVLFSHLRSISCICITIL